MFKIVTFYVFKFRSIVLHTDSRKKKKKPRRHEFVFVAYNSTYYISCLLTALEDRSICSYRQMGVGLIQSPNVLQYGSFDFRYLIFLFNINQRIYLCFLHKRNVNKLSQCLTSCQLKSDLLGTTQKLLTWCRVSWIGDQSEQQRSTSDVSQWRLKPWLTVVCCICIVIPTTACSATETLV